MKMIMNCDEKRYNREDREDYVMTKRTDMENSQDGYWTDYRCRTMIDER